MPHLQRDEILAINQKGWNKVASLFYGGTALPKYGPLAATEEELNLIPDLSSKRALELGCGSGHSLAYLWESKNARELWGIDFSEEQISFTKELLAKKGISAKLFLSSMDENPGIPENYFDLIVSIYSHRKYHSPLSTFHLPFSFFFPLSLPHRPYALGFNHALPTIRR